MRVMTLRPKISTWLPLLIVGLPIAAFGIWALCEGAIIGLAATAFGAIIVGYNATVRLTLSDGQIRLRRFGLTVWSSPTCGTTIESGRGGDLPILPAYLFLRESQQVGYVLRGWFAEGDIVTLQELLADGSSPPRLCGNALMW